MTLFEKKLILRVMLLIIILTLQLASFILQTTPQLWPNAVQDLVSMFHRSDSPDLQAALYYYILIVYVQYNLLRVMCPHCGCMLRGWISSEPELF